MYILEKVIPIFFYRNFKYYFYLILLDFYFEKFVVNKFFMSLVY